MRNNAAPRRSRLHPETLRAAVALAAGGAILTLLLVPSIALGVNTTHERADSHAEEYLLGATVKTTGSAKLAQDEEAGFNSVQFRVTGPNPAGPVALPVSPQTNHSLTDQLSQNLQTGGGTLSVDVSFTQIQGVQLGFGYGYGYKGLSSLAAIDWLLRYLPPVKLAAPPSALPGSFQSPTQSYGLPGGTGPTGPASVQLSAAFPVPGIPVPPQFTTFADTALDIAGTQFNSILVLLDGDSNSDIIVETDLGGFPFLDYLTDEDETTAVAVAPNGTPWMAYQDSGNWYVASFDNSQFPPTPKNQVIQLQFSGKTPTGPITSLVYDGTINRLFAAEFETDPTKDIHVWEIDPLQGQGQVVNVHPFLGGPTGGGFNGLDVNLFGSPPIHLGANGIELGQFDLGSGQHIGNVPLEVGGQPFSGDIVGLAIVPDPGDPNNAGAATMVIVDGSTKTVYTGGLPTGGAVATNIPQAIAQHGQINAFVLIEPSTIHYVPTSGGQAGTSLLSFQTPNASAAVRSLTYLGNKLYAIDNQGTNRRLYSATVTGGGDGVTPPAMGAWSLVKTLPQSVGNVGALASKSNPTLYAAEVGTQGQGGSEKIHVLDTSGNTQGLLGLFNPTGFTPNGLNGLAFIPAAKNPSGGTDVLVGVRGNQFFRINPALGQGGGQILNVDFVSPGNPPFNMRGLAANQTSGVITAVDRDTVAAYLTVIPGTPATESTAIGDYTAEFIVDLTNQPDPADADTDFELIKTATLDLEITEVGGKNVAGVTDPTVGVTTSSVLIKGTVLDPTVTQVGVQADLAEVVLVGAPAGAPTGASEFETSGDQGQWAPNSYWHFTNNIAGIQDIVDQTNTVAYFGRQQDEATDPNYCNPNCQTPEQFQQPIVGDLNSASFKVGQETTLTFDTFYDTEPVPEWDRKEIYFCETGAQCTKLAQIIDPFAIFVPGFDPNSVTPGAIITKPGSNEKFIMIPAYYEVSGTPTMVSVELDLPATLSGKTGTLLFKFDSGDPFGNHFLGWVLDDVLVEGAGTQLLSPATVDASTEPPTWQLTLNNVKDGTNMLTITANRDAYDATSDSVDLTLIKDTTQPVVDTLVAVSLVTVNNQETDVPIVGGVTAFPSVKVTGSFTEATPKELNVYINGKSILKKTSFSNTYEAKGTLSSASSGVNTIAVVLQDQAGLCNTTPNTACTAATSDKTLVVNLDNVAPAITKGAAKYPIGFNSVRAGKDDFVVFHLDATDTNGVKSVKAKSPGSSTFDLTFRNDIPGAVKDQWGVDKEWVLPFKPSSAVFPGTLTVSIQVEDNAGNTNTDSATAVVTAALGGFVFNLLPGQNFLSLPIIPSIADTTTLKADVSLNGQNAGMVDNVDGAATSAQAGQPAIDRILYYDATLTGATGQTTYEADPSLRWSVWTSDTGTADSLTKLRTGKGYLFMMKADAFASSAPLAAGLPASPAPIQFTYTGTFLLTGQSIPPSYAVEGTGGAWNMAGFHSEDSLPVTTYLQSMEAPQRIWASVLEYKNFINFPLEAGANPEVVLGTYSRLLASSSFTLGRGFWMFALADGQIVP